MKDLILISNYTETFKKQEVLRNLVNQIVSQKDAFDLMIVSHTPLPQDIQNKSNYTLYDSKNELLYDPDLRGTPFFSPNNDRQIISIYTGYNNPLLAIWRMIILGNSLAKNLGYEKVHHIEYDASIVDFNEIFENSKLLDTYDSIFYKMVKDNVLFGSYQAYKLSTLPLDLLVLDEPKLKSYIRNHPTKNPEKMLQPLLESSGNYLEKPQSNLSKNNFALSNTLFSYHIAWCLPFYDDLTHKLGFVVWNKEKIHGTIEVKLIYNEDKFINLGKIKPGFWRIIDIDDFKNSKSLIVLLNNEVRNIYDFTQDREKFKKHSKRKSE